SVLFVTLVRDPAALAICSLSLHDALPIWSIADYQSRTDVVDLGTQASAYFGKVSGLDQQSSQLDLQIDALQDVRTYVQSKGKNQIGEHTSELQSRENLVCRLLLEKKKQH